MRTRHKQDRKRAWPYTTDPIVYCANINVTEFPYEIGTKHFLKIRSLINLSGFLNGVTNVVTGCLRTKQETMFVVFLVLTLFFYKYLLFMLIKLYDA